MEVEKLFNIIDSDFYTGVPDSQLKALCNFLMNKYGINSRHHIIAANEGNAVALAAGYHLATGKIPVVYMQNSGEGNVVNPVASLTNDEVYSIPQLFIIGWRGEPNVHDEPQHIYQGKITLKLLENLGIEFFILTKETTEKEISDNMLHFKKILSQGKSTAFVVKKEALVYSKKIDYCNNYILLREEAIKCIMAYSNKDIIVSTTGKTSRELFEIREQNHKSHDLDFLTLGSMGHCSSIALGIALNKPERKIWCLDGDGALLMHMGAMAVIGNTNPKNLIHVVINNSAHESVGGMPTVVDSINLAEIAKGCGYKYISTVDSLEKLEKELKIIKDKDVLTFLEVKCKIGSRKDLGRPTKTPLENKNNFMRAL